MAEHPQQAEARQRTAQEIMDDNDFQRGAGEDPGVGGEAAADAGGHAGGHGLAKSSSCPGPGDYMWSDEIHLRKKPVWSMSSPERKNLDLLLGTWTPASTSLQPRAPDPGEYGTLEGVGRNGKFNPPRWSFDRVAIRPCLAPPPPERIELELNPPGALGERHPGRRMMPQWSVSGVERKNLAPGKNTWTPQTQTEIVPGPGTYDLSRRPGGRKASSRKGSFGGRKDLHPDQKAWARMTAAAKVVGSDGQRRRPQPGGQPSSQLLPCVA